jgi:hypothetical protein
MYNVTPPNYPMTSTDEYFHYTTLKVDGFAGLQIRNGPYGAVSSKELSDGAVHFCGNKDLPVDQFLIVAEWVSKNGKPILERSLESFVDQYWEMRDLVIECLIDEDPDDVVPKISNFIDLKKLCGIAAVHVGGINEDGNPLFGVEFGCTWEDEHGAGARFIGEELVESGEASDAFSF